MSIHHALTAGRIFLVPLTAIGVVVLSPDASDLWLLSGVILGMSPTFAAVGRNTPARVISKLSGSLVMGMAAPMVMYHVWQHHPLVQELSRIGWIWVAFGFVCSLCGWALVRAAINLFTARVIRPIERLAGEPRSEDADVFKAETSVPPESFRAPKRRNARSPANPGADAGHD